MNGINYDNYTQFVHDVDICRRDMLYVFLNDMFPHAGFAHKTHFSKWSNYKFLNGSVLNIADPMCQIYEGLRLGWYYGNMDFSLRIYVSEIVKLVAEKMEVSNDHIIFYGSSDGSAAVIECASHIEYTKAVSINPQIALFKHFYAHDFERITYNNLLPEDSRWHRNNCTYATG